MIANHTGSTTKVVKTVILPKAVLVSQLFISSSFCYSHLPEVDFPTQ